MNHGRSPALLRACRTGCVALALFALAALLPTSAFARTQPLEIEAQPTETALLELAESAGVQIMFEPGIAEDSVAPAVKGKMSVKQALDKIVKDTDLEYERVSRGVIVVRRGEAETSEQDPQTDGSADADDEVQSDDGSMDEPDDASGEDEDSGEKNAADVFAGEIVVTGSELEVEAGQLSKQVITLDAEELEALGEPTLERALARLPQNFGGAQVVGTFGTSNDEEAIFGGTLNVTGAASINLRGMGQGETLVLVNGNRIGSSGLFGGTHDIANIPFSRVERVEIMLDGASAIYGAEAIGGVVNIILKKDYDGLDLTMRTGAATSGGTTEQNVTLAKSFSWDTGNLTVTADVLSEDEMLFRDSPAREELNIRQSLSTGLQVLSVGMPPNVRVGLNGDIFSSPSGSSAPSLDELSPGAVPFDATGDRALVPERDRFSFSTYLEQDFSESVRFVGSLRFATRDTVYQRGPIHFVSALLDTDPLNPFDERIYVNGQYPAFGNQFSDAETENLNLNLGLEGDLKGAWTWELESNYAANEAESVQHNFVDTGTAIGGRSGFNPWGDGLDNSEEVLDKILPGNLSTLQDHEERGLEARVRGPLFETAAGPARAVFAVEYREEDIGSRQELPNVRSSSTLSSGANVVPAGVDGRGVVFLDAASKQTTLKTEVLIPLLANRKGAHRLDFQFNARYDDYDRTGASQDCITPTFCFDGDAGNTFSSETWGAGFSWSATERVRFKANRNTAFRVPELIQAYQPTVVRDSYWFYDATLGQWQFQADPYTERFGGNPDLGPQRSTHNSLAVEFLLGDSAIFGIDWHETMYRDKIASAFDLVIVPGFAEAYEGDLIVLRENGEVESLENRYHNLAKEIQEGFDLSYEQYFGAVGLNVVVSRLTDFTQFGDRAGLLDPVDLLGVRVPKVSGVATLSWRGDNWFGAWSPAYRGSTDTAGILTRGNYTHRDSHTLHNLNLGYEFQAGAMQGARLTLQVNNLTDEMVEAQRFVRFEPDGGPFITGAVGDPRGRMVSLTLQKSL